MRSDPTGETTTGAGPMVGFGPKQAWLAIRAAEPAAIIAALGLRDLGEAGWRDGIDLAYLTDDRIAITPPLTGANGHRYRLVPGRWLLGPQAATDVAALSARLHTEVQFFATHRVIEFHRWERSVDGVLVRAFEWIGEAGDVTRWRGDPDDTERAIGLPAALARRIGDHAGGEDSDDRDSDSNEEDEEPGEGPDVLVNEADVMRIAAVWSVDPTTLEGMPASGPLRIAAGEAPVG